MTIIMLFHGFLGREREALGLLLACLLGCHTRMIKLEKREVCLEREKKENGTKEGGGR